MRQIIVITGASSGFGALTAHALAKSGHTVYAGMRDTAGRNAPRRQSGVDVRAGYRPVPEPSLDGPGVVALVGKGVAAGVAQHQRRSRRYAREGIGPFHSPRRSSPRACPLHRRGAIGRRPSRKGTQNICQRCNVARVDPDPQLDAVRVGRTGAVFPQWFGGKPAGRGQFLG